MKKEDHYIQTFMGTTYEIGRPETVGGLKKILEAILADLPKDDSLAISEVTLRDDKLYYILVEGIPQ